MHKHRCLRSDTIVVSEFYVSLGHREQVVDFTRDCQAMIGSGDNRGQLREGSLVRPAAEFELQTAHAYNPYDY